MITCKMDIIPRSVTTTTGGECSHKRVPRRLALQHPYLFVKSTIVFNFAAASRSASTLPLDFMCSQISALFLNA